MRILLVGGGTGGHFYPLIAIAEAIQAEAKANKLILPELYYMGPNTYDEGSLFASGITFVRCPAGKFRRYNSFLNILDIFKTGWGVLVAIGKLFIMYPDVVMSKGGYTSVPVTIAAWLLRIPVVIHESDAVPGRGNKLAARFARYIGISYDDAATYFPQEKVALVGIPVRSVLLTPPSGNPHEIIGIPAERPLILILGGSQGAERVNDLIVSTLDELLPQYEILHQTGRANESIVAETARALVEDHALLERYHIRGFMDVTTMHAAQSAAALVITRAGSTSIYETALHGNPSIIIPLPESISHDQRKNAYAYARTKAASVIEEQNVSPHLLASEINRIIGDAQLQSEMSAAAEAFVQRDAASKMAQALIQIGREHE